MPRNKRHRSLFARGLTAAVLLSCGALLACHSEAPSSWVHVDLCSHPLTTDNLAEADQDLETSVDFALLGGHMKLRRAIDDEQKVWRRMVGGSIQTLEANLDVLLRWQIDLGQVPYLSFRPLSQGSEDCYLNYRIGVLDEKGVLREVLRQKQDPERTTTPDLVRVDLAAFAGQSVELLATVSPNSECADPGAQKAVWGSPAVLHKMSLPPAEDNAPLNFVLIGLDTVRADVIGAYGAEPSVTPSLDALAAESDVWLNAFATFNATNPSFASILTGLYGKRHGVYDLQTPLPEQHQTLAEILRQAGYDTGAILSARHLGKRQSGLGQGFETYRLPDGQFAAESAVGNALSWIGNRRENPFFLWLHLFDPHTPHTPPEPFATGYGSRDPGRLGLSEPEWVPFRLPAKIHHYTERALGAHRALYFGELAYTDYQIGRLLDFLRSRKLLDHTIIAVVADHGENLGENGISYRHSGLWDTTTHVPLMIRWPGEGNTGRRFDALVQTVDLFPSILRRLGLDTPTGIDGRLLAGLEGAESGRRVIYAEHASGHGEMIRSRNHLLKRMRTHHKIPDGDYLYDLERDPEQRKNLAGRGLPVEDQLNQALDAWLADRSDKTLATPVPLSPEEIEQLRALGYATP